MIPTIEMIPLSKLRDNPWRDRKLNPIDPERVEALAESIVATKEFWIGVYGRKMPDGTVQLAFGHHRADAAKSIDTGDALAAAKSAGLKAIPVALEDFTDGEMLMRMTRENLRGDLPVVKEAVSAAVRALAEGKIEIPAPERTNPNNIRYAPSFVPGKKPTCPSEGQVEYTADTLARFLGGIYIKGRKDSEQGRAQNSVVAALGIFELEEKRIPINVKDLPIRAIIPMISEIKERVEKVQARRDKTAAEITAYNEEQRALKAKAKADEEAAEAQRKATLQKLADAKRKEQEDRADALAAKLKENDQRAKDKEALNKKRMKELDETIARKKAWEAEQRVIDAYLPIRRDVEALLSKWTRRVSERDDEREQVKALAKLKALTPTDRLRLRKASVAVADHYNDWVAPQFAPLPTAKAEFKTMAKREVAKRKAEAAEKAKEKKL